MQPTHILNNSYPPDYDNNRITSHTLCKRRTIDVSATYLENTFGGYIRKPTCEACVLIAFAHPEWVLTREQGFSIARRMKMIR